MDERDTDCPGCYHNGNLSTDCGVYQDYGKGKHWFVIPVPNKPHLVACDFCNLQTVRLDEDGD